MRIELCRGGLSYIGISLYTGDDRYMIAYDDEVNEMIDDFVEIGNKYKVTTAGGYFFGKLLSLDKDSKVYEFLDLRRDYKVIIPFNSAILETLVEGIE